MMNTTTKLTAPKGTLVTPLYDIGPFRKGETHELMEDWRTDWNLVTIKDDNGRFRLFTGDAFDLAEAKDYLPGAVLILQPKSRLFAAKEGTEATISSKGLFYCNIVRRFLVDVMWPQGVYQAPGGYETADFKAKPKGKLTPQARSVLEMIREAGRITGVQAWNVLKVRSLPRRIADLRENGYNIKREMKADHLGQRYAEYTLAA